jgi:hypothetical protein
VVVHHYYCEANQVADALANHGCTLFSGCVVFDDCPSYVRHMILVDLVGVTTPHFVSI